MTDETAHPTPTSPRDGGRETSGTSGQTLHPRPSIRRIGRLGAALVMILFLVGLTVLTLKYSRETVHRSAPGAAQTATRPLEPEQIARLRPPKPPAPPELPEFQPADPHDADRFEARHSRPRRRRTRGSFEVRRPTSSSRSTSARRVPVDRVDRTASPESYLTAEAMALPSAASSAQTRSGEWTGRAQETLPLEPRRFVPSEVHAVRLGYTEPLSRYELKEGTYVPALLSHPLSSELAGPVRAQVSRDVYDSLTHRHLLIPRGTTLLGRQSRQPLAGERRISIVWDRLVLPDGRSVDLGTGDLPAMPSASGDGTLGLRGRVSRHWPRRLGTAAVLSLVGAGVQLSQPQRSSVGFNAASPEQLAAGELGLNLGRVSEGLLEHTLDEPPTVELSAGARVFVWITRDLAFTSPYSR